MKANFFVRIGLLVIAFFGLATAAAAVEITEAPVATYSFDQSETAIAVDPLNNQNLMGVWNDFRPLYPDPNDDWVIPGYGFSTDGGYSWSIDYILPDTFSYGYDPSCAFDRYGYAFYCYCASNHKSYPGPLHVSKTANAGTTWSHYMVHDGIDDMPFVAVDNTGSSYEGRIYVSWTDFSQSINAIKLAYSADHGDTWSEPITLTSGWASGPSAWLIPRKQEPPPPTQWFVQGSVPAVGPNGEVYVVWLNTAGTIELRKSTDGGETFGDTITVADITGVLWRYFFGSLRVCSIPTIAVDQNTGYIYVAYAQMDPGTDINICFVRSTDGGQNWSSPTIPTDPAYIDNYWQFYPWLSVDPTGMIHLVYYDDRSDHCDSIDTYVTQSLDNGESFHTPNLRVTSLSSDPNQGIWSSEYIGITSITGLTYPLWIDFRNENEDIYLADIDYTKSGHITSDEIWDYFVVVTGDVTVDSNVILTIQAGTDVRSVANQDNQKSGVDTSKCELIVYGTLNISGTDAAEVKITSVSPEPQPGDWYGIRILSGGSAEIQHANIEYGYCGIYLGSGSSAEVKNNHISHNEVYGIKCQTNDAVIDTNTIEYNERYGIYAYNCLPSIKKNFMNIKIPLDFQAICPILG